MNSLGAPAVTRPDHGEGNGFFRSLAYVYWRPGAGQIHRCDLSHATQHDVAKGIVGTDDNLDFQNS